MLVGEQGGGATFEAAACTAATLLETVLDAAPDTDVVAGQVHVGAVGTAGRVRAGRVDQTTLLTAVGTPSAPVQRSAVARLAHRPLGPPGGDSTIDAAAGAHGSGSWCAAFADRVVAVSEVAGLMLPAAAAKGFGQPIAVHADVGPALACPQCDRGDVAATPAAALSPQVTAAAFTDRRTIDSASSDRLDRLTVAAGGRTMTVGAPAAHAALVGGRQRPSGAAADAA